MATCSFCRSEIERGTGKLHAKRDGTSVYFCGSKCEKNALKLGRNPRHLKWTGAYAQGEKRAKK